MFRNQIDTHESGRPCYSKSFDCLLSIAKGHIFHPQSTPIVEESQQHWQELNENPSFQEDLDTGVNTFSRDLAKAINYLNSPATLTIDPEEPAEIPAALQVLDEAVILGDFLQGAVNALSPAIPDSVQRQCQLMVLEMTTDHLPPCHRLIPLNKWRIQTRETIPKEHQYLFTWYDLWTGVPGYTIAEMIAHWPSVAQNDVSCLEMKEDQAKILLRHIKTDAPYLKRIESSSQLQEKTKETLEKSVPLGLMALENSIGFDNSAPDIAVNMGCQATACAVISSLLASEQDRHEKILLAAFYGPDLDDLERIDLLKKVSTWITALKEKSHGSLTHHLQVWCNDRLTGKILLDESSKQWAELLEQAASAMPQPIEYRAGAFHQAVEALLQMKTGSILDGISDWLEALRTKIPTVRLLPEVPTVECLLQTAFPQPFAVARADSCGAECLYIEVEDKSIDRVDKLRIERPHCDPQDGKLTVTGRIVFLANTDYPDELSCGLLVDEELVKPYSFTVNPENNEFQAKFIGDEEMKGELRIVLVHQS